MRLRNVPQAKEIVAKSPFVIHDAEKRKGRWKDLSDKPIYLEIGMGKGRFLIEHAQRHPDREYLGMERYESVLFRACERMAGEGYKTPYDQKNYEKHPELLKDFRAPQNLHFLDLDAKALPDIFEKGEVDHIFLNFSDPWPKARHAKRRLTSHQFLHLYEQILKDGGLVEFKTDNAGLFEFSVEEAEAAPRWEILTVTRNLHGDPVLNEDNIMTEYERKFSALGNKICKMVIRCREF